MPILLYILQTEKDRNNHTSKTQSLASRKITWSIYAWRDHKRALTW